MESVEVAKTGESVWFSKEELLKDENLICDIIEEFESIEETLFDDSGLRSVFPLKSSASPDSLHGNVSGASKRVYWSSADSGGNTLEDRGSGASLEAADDQLTLSFCNVPHLLSVNSDTLMNIYDLTASLRDNHCTELNVLLKLKAPFILSSSGAVECYLQGNTNNSGASNSTLNFDSLEFPAAEANTDSQETLGSGVVSADNDYSADSLTKILTEFQEHYGASQVWMVMPSKGVVQQSQSELELASAATTLTAQYDESYGEYLDDLMGGGSVGGFSADGYEELQQLRQSVADLEKEISRLQADLVKAKNGSDPNSDINYKIYCEYVNAPKNGHNADKDPNQRTDTYIQPQPVRSDYPTQEAFDRAVDAHLQMTLSEIRRRHDEELVLNQLIKTKTQLANISHELDTEKLRNKKLKTRMMELKGFLQRNEHRFR